MTNEGLPPPWLKPGPVDKRDECGCHHDCMIDLHDCEHPCVWPNCLTPTEEEELLANISAQVVDDLAAGFDPGRPE